MAADDPVHGMRARDVDRYAGVLVRRLPAVARRAARSASAPPEYETSAVAPSSAALARVADTLTASRAVVAIVLVPAIAGGHNDAAAVLLALAWCTDMLDGRIARRAGTEGRLGSKDLHVDTAVGVAVLVGLALAGHAPALLLAIAVVLGGAFALSGNAAAGLGLQTIAYAWFVVSAWRDSAVGRWLLPVVIVALLVIDLDRFLTVEVPRFLAGVARIGDRVSRSTRQGRPP